VTLCVPSNKRHAADENKRKTMPTITTVLDRVIEINE